MQEEQEFIRRGFAKLLKGEIAIPMDVRSFPSDAEFLLSQKKIQEGILAWLSGNESVNVTLTEQKK